MNALGSLLLKLSGMGWIWGKVNGAKAYIGGAVTILGGLSSACLGLVGILKEVIACPDLGCLVGIVRTLGEDQNALLLTGGLTAIGVGINGIGNRHALQKAVEPAPKA